MHSKSFAVLVVGALLAAVCLVVWAPAVTAQQAPQRSVITIAETKIRASVAPQWEEGWKERNALLVRFKRPYPYTTLQTDDHRYFFLTPVEDLADYERWAEANQAVIDEAEAAGIEPPSFPGFSVEYTRRWWVQARPEMSYVPENPRVSGQDINFFHTEVYYGGGQQLRFVEQLVALYKSKGIRDALQVYSSYAATGPEGGGAVMLSTPARNMADYFEQLPKTLEMLGPEGHALLANRLSRVRKVEKYNFTLRRDLSYRGPE